MNKVWNHRYEAELIAQYKKGRSPTEILNHFRDKFSQDAECFSTIAMRSKLCKILRQAIRKFYALVTKEPRGRFPPMKRINENAARGIIYNNNGMAVRLHLLDIYLDQNCDEQLLASTIYEITRYVETLEHTTKLNSLLQESFVGFKPKRVPDLDYYRGLKF